MRGNGSTVANTPIGFTPTPMSSDDRTGLLSWSGKGVTVNTITTTASNLGFDRQPSGDSISPTTPPGTGANQLFPQNCEVPVAAVSVPGARVRQLSGSGTCNSVIDGAACETSGPGPGLGDPVYSTIPDNSRLSPPSLLGRHAMPLPPLPLPPFRGHDRPPPHPSSTARAGAQNEQLLQAYSLHEVINWRAFTD